MKIKIKRIGNGILPEYKREGDACLDCYARCDEVMVLKPKDRVMIPLGFALELPEGYEAVIRPRSGLSKNGIDSCIGTIDANYRGELNAILINNSDEHFVVSDGMRICQISVRQTLKVEWNVVDELNESNRGENGFGSTGV